MVSAAVFLFFYCAKPATNRDQTSLATEVKGNLSHSPADLVKTPGVSSFVRTTPSKASQTVRLSFDSLERTLFSESDLGEIFSSKLAAAKSGDAEAKAWVWGILDHCMGTLNDGGTSNEQLWKSKIDSPTIPQRQRDFYSAEIRRCNSVWTQSSTNKIVDASDWLQAAASAGQPIAEGYSAAHCEELALDPNRCTGYLHALLQSGQPEVLDVISSLSARSGDSLESAPKDAMTAVYGIDLAKCELGADCSPNSAMMIGLCNFGCPAFSSVQAAIQQKVDPATYQAASEYSRHLVTMVRSGTTNWPELQQVEKILDNESASQSAAMSHP